METVIYDIGDAGLKNGCVGIEINPIKETDFCEVCEEGEEDFWSVYVRLKNGEAMCIADCPTKGQAQNLKDLILKINLVV